MFIEELEEVVYTEEEKISMYEYVSDMVLSNVSDLDE